MAYEADKPKTSYGQKREMLEAKDQKNEILADLAGVEYDAPDSVPSTEYSIAKRMLEAAQKEIELLGQISGGGGGGGGGDEKSGADALAIDYATDLLSLREKGVFIPGSAVTLPTLGLEYESSTGGLTLTKNGAPMQGQTVAIPPYGSPLTASDAADMTDPDKVYVYTGETTASMTNGHWYYYDGSSWEDGGTYNSQGIDTDTMLAVSGAPADAKATGDSIAAVKDLAEYTQASELATLMPYATDGTGSASNITATMRGNVITLNGTSAATSSQGYTKIHVSGAFAIWNATSTPDAAKVYPLKLVSGHTYRMTATVLGGTRDKGEGAGNIRLRLASTAANVVDASLAVTDNLLSVDYKSDGTPLALRVCVGRLLTCTNLKIEVSLSDVTDEVLWNTDRRLEELFPGMIWAPSYADDVYQGKYRTEGGYYDKEDGTEKNGAAYARTRVITKFGGRTLRAVVGEGYNLSARLWDANGTFDPSRNTEFARSTVIFVPVGWKVAFNFRNDAGTNLDSSDDAAIRASFALFTTGTPIEMTTCSGAINFNDLKQTGTYRFASDDDGEKTNQPTDDWGRLIVINSADGFTCAQFYISYKNEIYSRVLTKASNDTWTSWKLYDSAGSEASMHDGERLRMASAPDPIPAGSNPVVGDYGDSHMGYDEFISSTWDTLLPNNYSPGDAYNENTTKIINVHVEKESNWQSTPYGSHQDVYTIHRYTFTPVNGYKKTAFLTSGCHGNEAEGYWGLYRLIRMIYDEGYKYPTLRNLRNVRFIIIPSWNPWGMQHYRRYNAFEGKNLQAWNWLWAEDNTITVGGVDYPISSVGEAKVIRDTLDEFAGQIDLWIDFHTDPYAGRTTSEGEIDDPRGYTDPYGFYGFTRKNTTVSTKLRTVMEDYYTMLKAEQEFTEAWHFVAISPHASGSAGFSGWLASMPFPAALVEASTFMANFPYASGSAGLMKLTQEFYGDMLSELICLNGWN